MAQKSEKVKAYHYPASYDYPLRAFKGTQLITTRQMTSFSRVARMCNDHVGYTAQVVHEFANNSSSRRMVLLRCTHDRKHIEQALRCAALYDGKQTRSCRKHHAENALSAIQTHTYVRQHRNVMRLSRHGLQAARQELSERPIR